MVFHRRSPAALGAVAFLLALPGGGVAVASPVTDALPAIRAVDHEGKGNAAAAKAWRVIAAADASALPDILGRDIYLGFLYGPSRLNPGDPPSRLRPLAVIVADLPAWARDLLRGVFDHFDDLTKLPKQSRVTAGWASHY